MGKNLIQQKRGKGSPSYRRFHRFAPGMAKVQDRGGAVILDLLHSQFHTAPLAKVQYEDGEPGLLIAPEGVRIGQRVEISASAPLETCESPGVWWSESSRNSPAISSFRRPSSCSVNES